MRGLVTAYSPFLGRSLNQSQAVLEEIRRSAAAPVGWHTQTWPVILPTIRKLVSSVLSEPKLRWWLAIGEGQREGDARLEMRAHNHFDLRHNPNAAGDGPLEGNLDAAGPPSLAAHWPAEQLGDHLKRAGFSIELSVDAGSHCCNALLFLGTLQAQKLPFRPWVGFLHLPRQNSDIERQAEMVIEVIQWLNEQFL